MSSVILASSSPGLIRSFQAAADNDLLVFPPDQLPPSPAQVLALAEDASRVRAVVLDTSRARVDDALKLADRFDQQFPSISVFLVHDGQAELTLAALRAGVRDLLPQNASVGDIRLALERTGHHAASWAGSELATVDGKVIMVTSPKGGVGKTTVATNLAIGLAADASNSTVLVDLDVQFGDVATALKLDPDTTLADAAQCLSDDSLRALRTRLTRHRSGLQVLCGVSDPADADDITPHDVSRIVSTLATQFRYVVLDTAPGLGEHTVAALEHATDIVFVMSLDVAAVRGLYKELTVLDSMELPRAARHVVVNQADRAATVSVADAEAAIGRPADVVVPRSDRFAEATNQGVPVLESGGRDKSVKALNKLVCRLTAAPARVPAGSMPRERK